MVARNWRKLRGGDGDRWRGLVHAAALLKEEPAFPLPELQKLPAAALAGKPSCHLSH